MFPDDDETDDLEAYIAERAKRDPEFPALVEAALQRRQAAEARGEDSNGDEGARQTSIPTRQLVSSGGPWEARVGYSRAVRVGALVAVAGTTAALADGAVAGEGDAYAQAMQALRTIEAALREVGAELRHVIRTRMFVVNIADWEAIGRAHAAFFADVRPAATMVEVSRLIDPRLLVEIEADAVIDE
ncbi:MAG TPA: RidA family protein [Ktedonobacterales bacterium]|nr:RidA family protein [Ktedonobacterales bacterium]